MEVALKLDRSIPEWSFGVASASFSPLIFRHHPSALAVSLSMPFSSPIACFLSWEEATCAGEEWMGEEEEEEDISSLATRTKCS